MSSEVVDAIRAELIRRGFEPEDDDPDLEADVLVLDDVELMVEPLDVPWIGARLVILVAAGLPDDPRISDIVAQAGEHLPPTARL